MSPYGKLDKDSEMYKNYKLTSDSKKAISLLLEKVPDNRNCDDVDIPIHYCTCVEFTVIDKTQPFLKQLAILGINSINSVIEKLNSMCLEVSFADILSAEIKILKERNTGANRMYKILISINEVPDAVFELYGYSATHNAIIKHLKPDGFLPTIEFTLNEDSLDLQLVLQLQEIIRVDELKSDCQDSMKN